MCTWCYATACPAARCAPGWSSALPPRTCMLPCWLLLHQQCLASPARIALRSPPLCSALPGSSRPDGAGFGHRQSSCISCRAQAAVKPGPAEPQGLVLGPVQAPLCVGRRGIGGTPMPQPRQSEPKQSKQGPASWVGGRLPRQGVQALALGCAPRGQEQSSVQAEKHAPSSAPWGGVGPSPLCTVVWDASVPLALLQLCKASAGLAKSPMPCMAAGLGQHGQGGCWYPP